MRSRGEIERDPKTWEATTVEVLLDIRDLLIKQEKAIKSKAVKQMPHPKKKIGRPKKVK